MNWEKKQQHRKNKNFNFIENTSHD